MERFLAIVNPAAGGGRCGKLAPAALQRLQHAGLDLQVEYTCAPAEATRLARAGLEAGVRDFIAVGGDGTGFEVVNGVLSTGVPDERVSLGFVPLGTGNSFLRDFSNGGAESALDALTSGRRRSCDVIRLTLRDGVLHYINILSLGFVADVCQLTNRRFKPFGPAGYVLGIVGALARMRPHRLPMSADGHELPAQTTFVSISNSRYTGGGMMMAPGADTGDGKADVVCVRELGRLALLRTFPRIFAGTHVRHPAVFTERVRSIEFEFEQEVDLMIDGEVVRRVPRRLDVLPGALDVRV